MTPKDDDIKVRLSDPGLVHDMLMQQLREEVARLKAELVEWERKYAWRTASLNMLEAQLESAREALQKVKEFLRPGADGKKSQLLIAVEKALASREK